MTMINDDVFNEKICQVNIFIDRALLFGDGGSGVSKFYKQHFS